MGKIDTSSTEGKIAVMQAYLDGKEIEAGGQMGRWWECEKPEWNWQNRKYRIKPGS